MRAAGAARSEPAAACSRLQALGGGVCTALRHAETPSRHCTHASRRARAGVFALLSASTSLMCVNLDNCSRLSMACCPGHFTVADEAAAIRSGLGLHAARPPSYARPPALVRMPC